MTGASWQSTEKGLIRSAYVVGLLTRLYQGQAMRKPESLKPHWQALLYLCGLHEQSKTSELITAFASEPSKYIEAIMVVMESSVERRDELAKMVSLANAYYRLANRQNTNRMAALDALTAQAVDKKGKAAILDEMTSVEWMQLKIARAIEALTRDDK